MRILVNTRLLIPKKLGGIEWFAFETLKRITNNNPHVKFYFVFDRAFSDEFIFANNIEPIVLYPPTRHPVLWYIWFEHQLPKLIKKLKPDIFLSPDGYISLKANVKTLAVIHDINFLHYPQDLPLSSNLFYNHFFPKYARKATRLATVSEFSKSDICKHYGISKSKIDVLYNGYNSVYKPISKEKQKAMKERICNGRDFFIFIGSLLPRKNVENMLLAYQDFLDKYNKKIDLVIVGDKLFMTKQIEATWQKMKNKDNVHFLGRLEPEQIRDVLASAIALVLVSKLEGFGIPVVEACASGTPVIVSNVSSLPEVAGEAAIYVDPFSLESISKAFSQITDNEVLREKLSKNTKTVVDRFSWDKTSDLLWASINKTLKTT